MSLGLLWSQVSIFKSTCRNNLNIKIKCQSKTFPSLYKELPLEITDTRENCSMSVPWTFNVEPQNAHLRIKTFFKVVPSAFGGIIVAYDP